jgi:uncharacterized membrane protein
MEENNNNQEAISHLADAVGNLSAKIDVFDARLKRLEEQQAGVFEFSALPPSPPVPESIVPSISAMPTKSSPLRAPLGEFKKYTGENLETYIGKRWLPIAGVISFLFGASFFLKYAFENNLIAETGRVILGIVGGLIFIGLGEYFVRKYQKFGWILTGGGIGLLYLSVFAAFAYYGLIEQTAAFGIMIIITLFGSLLAIRYDAQILFIMAIVGGFLTPYLVSTGTDNQLALFSYIALLDLGILFVSAFKNWRQVNAFGLLGTALATGGWFVAYYEPDKLWVTEFFFTLYFFIYLFSTVIAHFTTDSKAEQDDLGLMTVNAAWYFGWSYFLLKPDYDAYIGFFAATLGALYLALTYFARVFNEKDFKLTAFLGGIATVFITIAIPLQFGDIWITIAWAVEALVLVFVGFLISSITLRHFGLGVFAVALARLFGIESVAGDLTNFYPIFNKRFFVYGVSVIAASCMAYLYYSRQNILREGAREEYRIGPILAAVANFLVFIIITLDIVSFFNSELLALQKQYQDEARRNTPLELQTSGGYPAYGSSYYSNPQYQREAKSVRNQMNASLSVVWALYAIIMIIVGMVKKSARIRWGALALFGVVILKVFLIDLAGLGTLYRIISFIALGVILLITAFLYYQYAGHKKDGDGETPPSSDPPLVPSSLLSSDASVSPPHIPPNFG